VLYSWGRGAFGALGHDDGERDHFTPAKLSTLRFASHPVRRVACGASHCVVACTTNVLFGWGRNDAGQVGVGDASRAVLKPEVIVLSQGDSKQPVVRDVSAGAAHTVCVCVVRLGGQDDVIVYAWGDPANRRLGGVDEKKHASPQRLALLAKFMTRMRLKIATAPDRGERCIVSCGGAHTLLLTSICTLVAWGAGSYGQLGYGDVWDHDTPIIIPRVRAVIAFSAGARHSIAVEGVSDRKGPNEFEAAAKLLNLGDVFKPKPPKPKADDADEEAKPGKLWAWGFNSFGELGVGDVDVRLQPCAVRALDAATVKACAAGAQHSLALTTGDAVAFKDDARYQPSLAVLKERGGYRHLAKLKAKLEEDHLDSAGLDEPDAMVPGQPGVANVPARPSPPFEPALRYCLDTVPLANPRDKSRDIARRSSYEAVVRCLPCGLRLVCRACARRCHGGHAVEPSFVRWVPVEMVCGCLASGKCRVKWSKERAVFDGLVEATQKERISETDTRAPADEVLGMGHFRRLLRDLHPAGVAEDDFDSGEVGLHTAAGTTSWAAFEKWHTPYFEEKDREVEQLADFETEAAAAAAAGGRSPAPRRDNAAR